MKKPKIWLVTVLALALTSTIGMWGIHQTVAAVQDETEASKIHDRVDARLHHEKLTTLLGLTEEQLREKLKSGQSLASIAAEQNVDVQAVIDLHMDNVKALLDKRLAADKITEEDYNTKMQLAEERIVQHINGEHPLGFHHGHKRPKRPNGPAMKFLDNEELTHHQHP